MKRYLICNVILWVFFGLYLLFRIKFGLDFTDEMQFYGQLSSLTLNGAFFKSDLFIQQLGYVFLYPIMFLFKNASPDLHYLILFVRVLFAVYIFLITLYVFRKFKQIGIAEYLSVILAISLGIAVFIDGIFTFSYNTIFISSFIMFALFFLDIASYSKTRDKSIIALIVVVALVSYPSAGFAYLVLILLHMNLLSSLQLFFRIFLIGLLLFAFLLVSGVLSLSDLSRSLEFSSEFNIQSRNIFVDFPTVLVVFVIVSLITRFVLNKANIFSLKNREKFLIFISLLLFAFIFFEIFLGWRHLYFLLPFSIYFLLILAAHLCVNHPEWPVNRDRLVRLLDLWLVLGVVVSISSSSGILKLFHISLIIYPFICAILLGAYDIKGSGRKVQYILLPVIFLFSAFVLHGISRPYRDKYKYSSLSQSKSVPEFKGVFINSTKSELLKILSSDNFDYLRNQETLVIGPHPWLYFALGLGVDSEMFFNHFRGSKHVRDFLILGIARNDAQYVLLTDISELSIDEQNRVHTILRDSYLLHDEIYFDQQICDDYFNETSYRIPNTIQVYVRLKQGENCRLDSKQNYIRDYR